MRLKAALMLGIFTYVYGVPSNCDCVNKMQCECKENQTVICKDITYVPLCLPLDTKFLHIVKSPGFVKLTADGLDTYSSLKLLSVSDTGLHVFDKHALRKLHDLETLEIIAAKDIESFPSGTFEFNRNLRTVKVENCPSFRILPSRIFASLPSLQMLDLRNNFIQEIPEDILHGSMNVRVIDLSDNTFLKQLPQKTFADLELLKQLSLTNCGLEVLYSEHVKTPYEKGSLTHFKAGSNPWKCDRMCDFVSWSSNTKSFSDIATMGNCTSPEHLKTRKVLSLQPAALCPPTSSRQANGAVFIVFVVMVSCVLMVAACFLFAGRLAKSCSTTSTSLNPVTITNTRRNGAENYSCSDTQDSHREPVAAGSVTMDSASPPPSYDDPPSYDEVVTDGFDFQVQ